MYSPKTWSITKRLTISFAASFALIQFSASVYLYWSLQQDILAQNQAELVEHLREVQLVTLDDKSKVIPSPQWQSHVLSREGIYMRILNTHDLIISESHDMVAPSNIFPKPTLPKKAAIWVSPNGKKYMLMATQVASRYPNDSKVIQVALDLSSSEEQFYAYRKKLMGVWLITVFAAIAIGYIGMRQGLSELRQIAQTAERINASHFDEDLSSIHPMPKELKELTTAFDAMITRLRNSFGQLSRFSGDLAHEFRTPLNNLMSATSVILSRQRTIDEYRELIEQSMEQYESMNHLIEAMLFLARAENKEIQQKFQAVDISIEFEKTIDFFEILADEKGISLLKQGNVQFVADPALLRRLLSNLVANAVRYCSKGDTITLKANQPTLNKVILEVIDTGEGIDPKHLPYLFDRFYQVNNSRSDGNVGLGLTIVKSIIELHGGHIKILSKRGIGTIIRMEFPHILQN